MLLDNEKQFLLSLIRMEPKWDLLSLPIDIKELPGIKFKLIKLEKMESKKRKKYIDQVELLFL